MWYLVGCIIGIPCICTFYAGIFWKFFMKDCGKTAIGMYNFKHLFDHLIFSDEYRLSSTPGMWKKFTCGLECQQTLLRTSRVPSTSPHFSAIGITHTWRTHVIFYHSRETTGWIEGTRIKLHHSPTLNTTHHWFASFHCHIIIFADMPNQSESQAEITSPPPV